MCEEEARVVQMRPVEKAAPALNDPVGGRVSCVLGWDAVVLGDGGVSSGDVGRYVYVGDVSVSRGGDMELCGIDTVLSVAVISGMCDLGRVSGGGDMDVSGVDMVGVTGAVSGCMCDLDGVSRGDLVVRVGEMSLSEGGDAVVSGFDESVYCFNSVLADGIIDLSGVDTVVYGVDESVGGVSSVMTADELDVCGCDSLVSDVVGDTLVCGAGVARSGREDTEAVVGPGMAQRGWVDGLIWADGSLLPEPPPIHAMCLLRIV